MYKLLYQYLINEGSLVIPGTGTWQLERIPAQGDFASKTIHAPAYAFRFQSGGSEPGLPFYSWLGHALGISRNDAVRQFHDFAFDLRKNIADGATIEWKGLGSLQKGLGGEPKFIPESDSISTGPAVSAVKVIRDKAEHMVRVGEDHKSSAEMEEMLTRKTSKFAIWKITAIVLLVLAAGFLTWFFMQNGFETATQCLVKPGEATEQYEVLH